MDVSCIFRAQREPYVLQPRENCRAVVEYSTADLFFPPRTPGAKYCTLEVLCLRKVIPRSGFHPRSRGDMFGIQVWGHCALVKKD